MGVSSSGVAVKVIGSNGQISLGKQFAGRQVLVEEYEPGVWLIRTATVVPDNERWLDRPGASADLKRALAWARANAAAGKPAERGSEGVIPETRTVGRLKDMPVELAEEFRAAALAYIEGDEG